MLQLHKVNECGKIKNVNRDDEFINSTVPDYQFAEQSCADEYDGSEKDGSSCTNDSSTNYDGETVAEDNDVVNIWMGIHIEPELEALPAVHYNPSDDVLKLQKELLSDIANLTSIRTQKINGRKTYWEDFALINNFALETDLNTTEVESLVTMFKQISSRQYGAEICLPKCWRTISDKINKNFASTFYAPSRLLMIIEHTLLYRTNSIEAINSVMKPVEAIAFSLKDVIANALLDIKNIENFITKPIIIRINDGLTNERVYKDYVTGLQFENYCNYLNANYRYDQNVPLPLCLGITMDTSTANTTRTRSECPVCLYILNVRNDDFKMHLLGYAPVTFPYSNEELHALLSARGCAISSLRNQIIKLIKTKVLYDFLYKLLEPINEYSLNGINVLIGTNNNTVYKVYPKICVIAGDTEMSDKINGTNYMRNQMKCRMCTNTNISKPVFCNYTDFSYRDWRESFRLGTDGEIILRNELFQRCKENDLMNTSAQYNAVNSKLLKRKLKERSMLPGQNNLHSLLAFQSPNFELNLHTMLVPDVLHTFYKGIVDFAISHALIILTCVQLLSKKQHLTNGYSNIMSEIDKRIINFTHSDALQPTRSCNFKNGISCFISDASKTKKMLTKLQVYYLG